MTISDIKIQTWKIGQITLSSNWKKNWKIGLIYMLLFPTR